MGSTLIKLCIENKIGQIKIGDTMESVISIIGEADDIAYLGKVKILKYGILELSFVYNKQLKCTNLNGIFLYFQKKSTTTRLHIEGWFPDQYTSIEDFKKVLEQNKLNYNIDEKYKKDLSQITIRLESGLDCIFVLKDDGFFLDSLQYFSKE